MTLDELKERRDELLNELIQVDNQIRVLTGNSGYVKVGNTALPPLAVDSGPQTIATVVNSGRNANAVVVGQKIGRDQSKIELKWSYLTANQWSEILTLFENSFFNDVTYFDMQKNKKITRKMYVNDRKARPFKMADGNPSAWLECSLNLIDTGKGS